MTSLIDGCGPHQHQQQHCGGKGGAAALQGSHDAAAAQLEAALLQEVDSLARHQGCLESLSCLLQQQQQHQEQQQQQQQVSAGDMRTQVQPDVGTCGPGGVRVLPLAGLVMAGLAARLQQYLEQRAHCSDCCGTAAGACCDAALTHAPRWLAQLLEPSAGPLGALLAACSSSSAPHAGGQRHSGHDTAAAALPLPMPPQRSTFLALLCGELLRVRSVALSAQAELEEEVAALGSCCLPSSHGAAPGDAPELSRRGRAIAAAVAADTAACSGGGSSSRNGNGCHPQPGTAASWTQAHKSAVAAAAPRGNSHLSGGGSSSAHCGSSSGSDGTSSSSICAGDVVHLEARAEDIARRQAELAAWLTSRAGELARAALRYDVALTAAALAAIDGARCGAAAAAAAALNGRMPSAAAPRPAAGLSASVAPTAPRRRGLAGFILPRRSPSRAIAATATLQAARCDGAHCTQHSPPEHHHLQATQGHHPHSDQELRKLESGLQEPPEPLLMTPGVCSHSCLDQSMRYTAGVLPDVYSQAAHRLATAGTSYEPVLWGLSVLHSRLRAAASEGNTAQTVAAASAAAAAAESSTDTAAQWTAPDQFTRSTTKYWVHPSAVLRVKLHLLRHLPLLVYGAVDPTAAADMSSARALRRGATGTTSLVSSVYFDSPALDVYHSRLARDDGARLVRLRYYGRRQTGPSGASQTVFVERKTHHEAWTGERSVKERASLMQAQVASFLRGGPDAAGVVGVGAGVEVRAPRSDSLGSEQLELSRGKEQLLRQVAAFLHGWGQVPALRTEYQRTAWQRYDSNSVRVSLDEHMLLLRECGVQQQPQPTRPDMPAVFDACEGPHTHSNAGQQPHDWCAQLESRGALPPGDAVRFPYAILELKLQEATPAWVDGLLRSGALVPVPRFSKFLHGMALLHAPACERTPSWFEWDSAVDAAVPRDLAAVQRAAAARAQWRAAAAAAVAAAAGKPGASFIHAPATGTQVIPPPSTALTATSSRSQGVRPSTPPLPPLRVLMGHGTADVDNSSAQASGTAMPGAELLLGIEMHTPLASSSGGGGLHSRGSSSTPQGSAAIRPSLTASSDAGADHHSPFSGSGPFNAGINSTVHHHAAVAMHHAASYNTSGEVGTGGDPDRCAAESTSALVTALSGSAASGGSVMSAGTGGLRRLVGTMLLQAGLGGRHPGRVLDASHTTPLMRGSPAGAPPLPSDDMTTTTITTTTAAAAAAVARKPSHANSLRGTALCVTMPPQLRGNGAADSSRSLSSCSLDSQDTMTTSSGGGSGSAAAPHIRCSASSSSLHQLLPCTQQRSQGGAATAVIPAASGGVTSGVTSGVTCGGEDAGSGGGGCGRSELQLIKLTPPHQRMPAASAPASHAGSGGGSGGSGCGSGRGSDGAWQGMTALPLSDPGCGAAYDTAGGPLQGPSHDLHIINTSQHTPQQSGCLSAQRQLMMLQGYNAAKLSSSAGGAATSSARLPPCQLPGQLPGQLPCQLPGQLPNATAWPPAAHYALQAQPSDPCVDVEFGGAGGDLACHVGGGLQDSDAAAAAATTTGATETTAAAAAAVASTAPASVDAAAATRRDGRVRRELLPACLPPVLPVLTPKAGTGSQIDGREGGTVCTAAGVVIDGMIAAQGAALGHPRRLLLQLRRGVRGWRSLGGRRDATATAAAAAAGVAASESVSGGGAASSSSRTNEHLLGFAGGAPPPGGWRVRTRVEPKTFFANERTFLAWLNVSVLVMLAGLGLLTGSSLLVPAQSAAVSSTQASGCMASLACAASRVCGAAIAAVSVLFMLYALYLFRKRTRWILERSALRYDDQTGPLMLTVLLVAVTLVSLALALHSARV